MGSILKGLNSGLFLRADDTSEDTAKLLMSGKFQEDLSQSPLSVINFTFPFTERCSYYAFCDTTPHFSSRFKSLIEIQKHF